MKPEAVPGLSREIVTDDNIKGSAKRGVYAYETKSLIFKLFQREQGSSPTVSSMLRVKQIINYPISLAFCLRHVLMMGS